MKSILIVTLVVLGLGLVQSHSQGFRHKKVHHKTGKRQEYNNDDRHLVSILEKISIGKKDKETAAVQTIIRKNEHFQSMDDMHSLDFEKVAEVRQGYGLRVIKDKS